MIGDSTLKLDQLFSMKGKLDFLSPIPFHPKQSALNPFISEEPFLIRKHSITADQEKWLDDVGWMSNENHFNRSLSPSSRSPLECKIPGLADLSTLSGTK